MRQDLRGCESRDDCRTLVAHALAADRTNEASERLFRPAAREKPALEAGTLGRRADHPDIAGIVSPQRRVGEAIIKCMAMREDDEGRARGRALDLFFRIVEALESDALGQDRGRGVAIVDEPRADWQRCQRVRKR